MPSNCILCTHNSISCIRIFKHGIKRLSFPVYGCSHSMVLLNIAVKFTSCWLWQHLSFCERNGSQTRWQFPPVWLIEHCTLDVCMCVNEWLDDHGGVWGECHTHQSAQVMMRCSWHCYKPITWTSTYLPTHIHTCTHTHTHTHTPTLCPLGCLSH